MPSPSVKTNSPLPPPRPKPSFMGDWFLQYYKLVAAATCLVILAVGYFFLLSPALGKIRNIGGTVLREETEREAALKKRIQYLVGLEALRQRVAEEDIARINEILPSEPGVPELLASLEAIASASAVKLEAVQLAKLETGGTDSRAGEVKDSGLPSGVEALETQLTVANTPYSNVKSLVNNLEKSLRLLDVVALLYSPAAKTYSLTVRSYYLP